jgi:hypothetical protein
MNQRIEGWPAGQVPIGCDWHHKSVASPRGAFILNLRLHLPFEVKR